MKIAVIGGAGFIGSHVVDRYLEDEHEVHVLDKLFTGRREYLSSQARLIELDVACADIRALLEEERYDIVNFHAFSDGSLHGTRPDEDVRNNLVALIHVLDAMAGSTTKKFIYASSGGVGYGESTIPHGESHRFDVRSPLGALRMAAESYINWYYERDQIPFTILRYANVYGPRQQSLGPRGLIPQLIREMMAGHPPVIYGNGEQTRDFIYVKDVARANLLALTSGAGHVFNIASQQETSVNTIFNTLATMMEFTQKPELASAGEDEIQHNVIDTEKAAKVLGFFPDYTLEDGLSETIEWFRAHSDSIQ